MGVWTKIAQNWGRGSLKTRNCRPCNAISFLKTNRQLHENGAIDTREVTLEELVNQGRTFRIRLSHLEISHTPPSGRNHYDSAYELASMSRLSR
jgi:hypothetical protein